VIAALLDHLWQSTLFCVAIWLITRTLRANRAALRHSLWMVASLKFLVPFAALYYIGALAGLPTPVGSQPVLFSVAAAAAAPVVSPTDFLRTTAQSHSLAGVALLGVWLLGMCVVATRWLLAWRAAESIVTAARPALAEFPDTRLTDADIEPAVARVIRPVLLLPVKLPARLTSRQLIAVLAHEREHMRRHDNLTAHFHRLIEALFWFHPVVWWIGHQLLEERERACDEAVLDGGHASADYAAGILAVCRHCGSRTPVVVGATSGNLTQRVRRILGPGRPRDVGFFKGMALLSGAVVAVVVPLIAGAADGSARRLQQLDDNARTLGDARFSMSLATDHAGGKPRVIANHNVVIIRDSSIRDLVALAYGVETYQVEGGGTWIDEARYDLRAVATKAVSDPENLDPVALRPLVTRLLASRFQLEIHVNSVCQEPCGRQVAASQATL
jgi:beta-lactamase regulating signal transducer with metallopeptidase domain